MITVIPSDRRHTVDTGWLNARWHFSFGDYHDPANVSFGPLRVYNDDVVQPGGGFDMHPHRDMEIVTYVIDGQLEHRDHLGHRGVLNPGEVQVMSAGKGILHSERNPSPAYPVHLNQIWIQPRTTGSKPRYDQRPFAPEARRNRLLPVVSAGDVPDTLAIDQDARIYVASLAPGATVTHDAGPARRVYAFVIQGRDVSLNGQALGAGDQARVTDESTLTFTATATEDGSGETELLLIDLP